MSEYSDIFSQADENPVSSGGAWQIGYLGKIDPQVVSHHVETTVAGATNAMATTVTTFGANQLSQATIRGSFTGEILALVLRAAAPSTATFYQASATGGASGGTTLSRVVAGVKTDIGTPDSSTWVAGDVMTFMVRESSLFVFQNGILRRSEVDTIISGSGSVGLLIDNFALALNAVEWSDFLGGDIRKTRFYLPNTGAPEISPAFTLGSSWTATTNADRIKMLQQRKSSTMTTKVQAAPGTTANQKWLFRQYVSDPLVGDGTIFGALFGQVRGLESAINDNINAVSLKLLVVKNDATLRGTLLSLANYGTVAELNTSLRNKIIANGGGLTPIAYSDGDRLVAELGLTNTTTGTSVSGSMSFGDDGASDLTEDETDASADNPWLEIVGMNVPIGGVSGPIAQANSGGFVGRAYV